MWPLWLIFAVAFGAPALTASSAILAIVVERRRHRKISNQNNINRNQSQTHRHHLSITDVDIANLPRPARSFRQNWQSPRRDSRFYSMMASEDSIRTFPDATGEPMAEMSYYHQGPDRPNQWLSTSKSKKQSRKKKSIKLSISAPMARSPMSVITERTESMRLGSPEPVELPATTIPRATPERVVDHAELLPTSVRHIPQESIESVLSMQERPVNRVSTRINNGNAIKSRSISMGNIVAPPDCPLPPVPEGGPPPRERKKSLTKSKSDISIRQPSMSLLNSPLSPDVVPRQLRKGNDEPIAAFSGFNFGLKDENVQVIRVDSDHTSGSGQSKPRDFQDFRNINIATDLNAWKANFTPVTPTFSSNASDPGSRRVSAISAMSLAEYSAAFTSTQSSPTKPPQNRVSRPTSVDFFRQSVIGPGAPVLAPESPRSKGHKRQNCIRISGVTTVDPGKSGKKRLNSQPERLAEAEETDSDDNRSIGIEIPTISPARSKTTSGTSSPLKLTRGNDSSLEVPQLKHPQALSLRNKRPGLFVRDGRMSPLFQHPVRSPTESLPTPVISPIERPLNPLTRSHTAEPRFVYAGSPKSDPTMPPPAEAEYSPILPLDSGPQTSTVAESTPRKGPTAELRALTQTVSYSPAPTSMLFSSPPQKSSVASPDRSTNFTSPRRHKTHTLYGPRNAPPPSLRMRTMNTVRVSPRHRQTSDQRSISPIRKASQTKTSSSSLSNQDNLKRSITLLKNLTHAAESGKAGGVPDVNVVRNGRSPSLGHEDRRMIRTPSSRYADSPEISRNDDSTSFGQPPRTTRQRSKTLGNHPFAPPKLRQESTYPAHPHKPSTTARPTFPYSPSSISIWEDDSISDQASSDTEMPHLKPTTRHARLQNQERQQRDRQTSNTLASIRANITNISNAPPSNSSTPVAKESLWKLQQNADLITSRALAYESSTPNRTNESILKPNLAKSPESKRKERKSKLDGLWGDKSAVGPGGGGTGAAGFSLISPSNTISQRNSHHQQNQYSTDSKDTNVSTTPLGQFLPRARAASNLNNNLNNNGRIAMGGGPTLRSRQRSHTVTPATLDNESDDGGMVQEPMGLGVGVVSRLRMKEGVGLGVDFGRAGAGAMKGSGFGSGGSAGAGAGVGGGFLNEMERDEIGRLR